MNVRQFLRVLGIIALPAIAVQAQEQPQPHMFSKVGRWTIFKYPDRCAALNQDFNDVLSMSIKDGRPVLALINSHMDIPAGDYPIGVVIESGQLGTPPEMTWTGHVLPNKGHAVIFTLKSFDDLTRVANADWIRFTLGGNGHMVNLQQGADALRMLPVCEKYDRDPFAQAK